MLDRLRFAEAVGALTRKLRSVSDRFIIHSDVLVEIRDRHGNLKHLSFQHNLRTNVGADFWNTQLFATGAAGAQANWIGLTTDVTAPSATDTVLPSEETLNGLARAQATGIAHTAGTNQTVLSKTFTYTGSSPKTIAKIGLLTASSGGTLVLSTLLTNSGTVSANGDTLTIQWTVTY